MDSRGRLWYTEARKLVMELDMDAAVREIQAEIGFLLEQPEVAGPKVGLTGFCMGGRLVLMTALVNDRLGAVVPWYGSSLSAERAGQVKAPVLGLYGEQVRMGHGRRPARTVLRRTMASSRPFEVTLDIPVRTYDIDQLQIVHNRVYVRWLEDLRFQVLAEYLPLQPLLESGISPLLLKTCIEYKRPVRLFDPLLGHMWMSALGRARYTLQAEFLVRGQLMASAEQTGCFVELATGRPVPIPKQVRDQW